MSTSLSPRPSGTPANPMRQQLDELEALLQRMLAVPVDKLESQNPDTAEQPVLKDSHVSYTAPEEPETQPAPKIDFQALKQQLAAQTQSAQQESIAARPPFGGEASAVRGPNLSDEPSPVAQPVDDLKGVSVTAESPGHEELPADRNEESWVPLSSTWQPSSLTWKPLAQSWLQSPTAAAPIEGSRPAVAEEEIPAWRNIPAVSPEPINPPPSSSQVVVEKMLPQAQNLSLNVPIERRANLLVWFNHCFDYCLWPFGPAGAVLRTPTGRLGLAILGAACLVAAAVVVLIDWIGWTS
jgi:hypothetical protein